MARISFLTVRPPPRSTRTDTLVPYTTLFRSLVALAVGFDAAPKLVGRAPFWQFLADPNYVFLGIQALLLQIWNYRASLSWNIPSWSISAEMHIYLMLPVIAVAIRRKPRITRVLLLGLSGAIYLFILLDRPRLDILDPLALLRCLAGFSLGVCLEQGTNIWSRLSRPAATIAQVLSRSEEHTSELQSLMRNSYAVLCLKKQKHRNTSKKSTG